MSELRNPTEIKIEDQDGVVKTFVISKVPATVGIELVILMPQGAIPKIGEYAVFEKCMYKLLSYTGVVIEGREAPLLLTTRALVDNHCNDWEVQMRLVYEMIKYNVGFFKNGRAYDFWQRFAPKLQSLNFQTLMDSLGQLSAAGKQRSES